jgi:hypothetical protein
MREKRVRECDIARTKDLIVIGICTPSRYELEAQAIAASVTLGDRQRLWSELGKLAGGLQFRAK